MSDDIDDLDLDDDDMDFGDLGLDDDMDFGDMDGEDFASAPVDDRNPVTASVSDAAVGFKEAFTEDKVEAAIDIAKAAIPSEISAETDLAMDTIDTVKGEYERAGIEVKKQAKSTFNVIKKFIPEGNATVDGLMASIADKLGANDEEGSSSGPSEAERIMTDVNNLMGEKQEASAIEELVKQQIEVNRSRDSQELLSIIGSNTERLRKFDYEITNTFYRRSIELQFRNLYANKELLDVTKIGFDGFRNQFETMIKNTALPDIVKIKSTEAIKAMAMQSGGSAIKDALFANSGPMGNFKKNLTKRTNEIKDSIIGGLEGVSGAGEMINMTEEMGISKSGMLGGLVADIGKSKLGKLAGKELFKNQRVQESAAAFKDRMADPEATMREMLSNATNPVVRKGLEEGIALIESNVQKGFTIDKVDLNEAKSFDNRTHTSIVKIIPGLLSKIYGELKSTRIAGSSSPGLVSSGSGRVGGRNTVMSSRVNGSDPEDNELSYDHKTGKFITTASVGDSVRRDVKHTLQNGAAATAHDLANTISVKGEMNLGKEDIVKLRTSILTYMMSKKATTQTAMLTSKPFLKNLPPELQATVKAGGKMIWRKVSGSKPLVPGLQDDINAKLKSIKSTLPSLEGKLRELEASGQSEVGDDLGLMKTDKLTGVRRLDNDGLKALLIAESGNIDTELLDTAIARRKEAEEKEKDNSKNSLAGKARSKLGKATGGWIGTDTEEPSTDTVKGDEKEGNTDNATVAEDVAASVVTPTPDKAFSKGGYTGDGGINEAAGVVHGKEFVINNKKLDALISAVESTDHESLTKEVGLIISEVKKSTDDPVLKDRLADLQKVATDFKDMSVATAGNAMEYGKSLPKSMGMLKTDTSFVGPQLPGAAPKTKLGTPTKDDVLRTIKEAGVFIGASVTSMGSTLGSRITQFGNTTTEAIGSFATKYTPEAVKNAASSMGGKLTSVKDYGITLATKKGVIKTGQPLPGPWATEHNPNTGVGGIDLGKTSSLVKETGLGVFNSVTGSIGGYGKQLAESSGVFKNDQPLPGPWAPEHNPNTALGRIDGSKVLSLTKDAGTTIANSTIGGVGDSVSSTFMSVLNSDTVNKVKGSKLAGKLTDTATTIGDSKVVKGVSDSKVVRGIAESKALATATSKITDTAQTVLNSDRYKSIEDAVLSTSPVDIKGNIVAGGTYILDALGKPRKMTNKEKALFNKRAKALKKHNKANVAKGLPEVTSLDPTVINQALGKAAAVLSTGLDKVKGVDLQDTASNVGATIADGTVSGAIDTVTKLGTSALNSDTVNKVKGSKLAGAVTDHATTLVNTTAGTKVNTFANMISSKAQSGVDEVTTRANDDKAGGFLNKAKGLASKVTSSDKFQSVVGNVNNTSMRDIKQQLLGVGDDPALPEYGKLVTIGDKLEVAEDTRVELVSERKSLEADLMNADPSERAGMLSKLKAALDKEVTVNAEVTKLTTESNKAKESYTNAVKAKQTDTDNKTTITVDKATKAITSTNSKHNKVKASTGKYNKGRGEGGKYNKTKGKVNNTAKVTTATDKATNAIKSKATKVEMGTGSKPGTTKPTKAKDRTSEVTGIMDKVINDIGPVDGTVTPEMERYGELSVMLKTNLEALGPLTAMLPKAKPKDAALIRDQMDILFAEEEQIREELNSIRLTTEATKDKSFFSKVTGMFGTKDKVTKATKVTKAADKATEATKATEAKDKTTDKVTKATEVTDKPTEAADKATESIKPKSFFSKVTGMFGTKTSDGDKDTTTDLVESSGDKSSETKPPKEGKTGLGGLMETSYESCWDDLSDEDQAILRYEFFSSTEFELGQVKNLADWLESSKNIDPGTLRGKLGGITAGFRRLYKKAKDNLGVSALKEELTKEVMSRLDGTALKELKVDEENELRKTFFASTEYKDKHVTDFTEWLATYGYKPSGTGILGRLKARLKKAGGLTGILKKTRSLDRKIFMGTAKAIGSVPRVGYMAAKRGLGMSGKVALLSGKVIGNTGNGLGAITDAAGNPVKSTLGLGGRLAGRGAGLGLNMAGKVALGAGKFLLHGVPGYTAFKGRDSSAVRDVKKRSGKINKSLDLEEDLVESEAERLHGSGEKTGWFASPIRAAKKRKKARAKKIKVDQRNEEMMTKTNAKVSASIATDAYKEERNKAVKVKRDANTTQTKSRADSNNARYRDEEKKAVSEIDTSDRRDAPSRSLFDLFTSRFEKEDTDAAKAKEVTETETETKEKQAKDKAEQSEKKAEVALKKKTAKDKAVAKDKEKAKRTAKQEELSAKSTKRYNDRAMEEAEKETESKSGKPGLLSRLGKKVTSFITPTTVMLSIAAAISATGITLDGIKDTGTAVASILGGVWDTLKWGFGKLVDGYRYIKNLPSNLSLSIRSALSNLPFMSGLKPTPDEIAKNDAKNSGTYDKIYDEKGERRSNVTSNTTTTTINGVTTVSKSDTIDGEEITGDAGDDTAVGLGLAGLYAANKLGAPKLVKGMVDKYKARKPGASNTTEAKPDKPKDPEKSKSKAKETKDEKAKTKATKTITPKTPTTKTKLEIKTTKTKASLTRKLLTKFKVIKSKLVKKLGVKGSSKLLAKLALRGVPVIGAGLLAYDAVMVAKNMYNGDNFDTAASKALFGFDLFDDNSVAVDENGTPIEPIIDIDDTSVMTKETPVVSKIAEVESSSWFSSNDDTKEPSKPSWFGSLFSSNNDKKEVPGRSDGESDGVDIHTKKSGNIRLDPIPVDTSPLTTDGTLDNLNLGKNVDVANLNPAVLKNLLGMAQDYRDKTGNKLNINSGYRSYAYQAALKKRLGAKAASPGKSTHEFGLAFDINSSAGNELEELGLMRKYGFTRPVGGEAWHVEPAVIQTNVSKAKNDPVFAAKAVAASVYKGGGGVGLVKGARKYSRDKELQVATFKGPEKVVNQTNETTELPPVTVKSLEVPKKAPTLSSINMTDTTSGYTSDKAPSAVTSAGSTMISAPVAAAPEKELISKVEKSGNEAYITNQHLSKTVALAEQSITLHTQMVSIMGDISGKLDNRELVLPQTTPVVDRTPTPILTGARSAEFPKPAVDLKRKLYAS